MVEWRRRCTAFELDVVRCSLDDVHCLIKARLMPIVAVRRPTCLAPCARCCTSAAARRPLCRAIPAHCCEQRTDCRTQRAHSDALLAAARRSRVAAQPCSSLFMHRPSALRGAANPAQQLTIYLMRVRMNRIALIVVQRPLGLVMKATFLIKCGIVNLVLRQNRQASSWPFA